MYVCTCTSIPFYKLAPCLSIHYLSVSLSLLHSLSLSLSFSLSLSPEEIQVLTSKGLTVSIRGERHKFQVGLLVFLANNLAAHTLGGFKESMSFANQTCRMCMATTEGAQTHFRECQFELRTASDHDRHCQLLKGPSSHAHSVAYGIN